MMESEQKKKKGCSSTCKRVLGILALCLSTLAYAAKVSISIYAWWGQPSRIGLKLSLQDAFTTFQLPISPANWTQALWLVIFLWEGLWILFTWRFAFNRFIPRTVYGAFYPAYSLACVAHIGWVFSWGRLIQELSLVLVALLTLLLMLCVGIASVHLYFIRGSFKFYYQCNFWLTRLLVLNGAVAYATFSLILTLFNLGAVLTVNAGLLGETASTIVLSLLSSIVVTYFLLENTIFDRFLRYIILKPFPRFVPDF